MDFISNLIKRPISLVLNETSATMDKYPLSASLPNTPIELNNKTNLATPTNEQQHKMQPTQNNHEDKRPLSLSSLTSSYNGDIMTDFIGVPEDFLDEFKDILPPPPLPIQNSNALTQSLLDMDNLDNLSITPPPPPLPLHLDKEHSLLTTSMKASQTIDDLLLQINDNLQQAGLNDDVLPIAVSSKKFELSPLSSKAVLNNSKSLNSSSSSGSNLQLNATKTATANVNEFENKFHVDADLENGGVNSKHHHKQHEQNQLNNSGVNKSSSKFVGLTEFDETKIPELPGDLNPNIEDQYSVTFEECFIPTLNAQQSATIRDEFRVDRTHFLLSSETEGISSDNETYADCNDNRDPLTSTLPETSSLDVTELESFQSATNRSLNSNFNTTMDNIADITMDAHEQPMSEDEPMDVDMSITMETTNFAQHVEDVLNRTPNILQQSVERPDNDTCEFLKKTAEPSKLGSTEITPTKSPPVKTHSLVVEQTKLELSLNKSIELPISESQNLSSTTFENHVSQERENELQETINKSEDNLNLTNNTANTASINNSTIKLPVENRTEAKLNLTLNLSSSNNSQKSSPPSSPTFPIKTTESAGFPRSPKALPEKPVKSPFLEKSDFIENAKNPLVNNSITSFFASSCDSETNNLSDSEVGYLSANATTQQEAVDTELQVKRRTFSIDSLTEDNKAEEKRRTFILKQNENNPIKLTEFPSLDKIEKRRTFVKSDEEHDTPNENGLPVSESNVDTRRKVSVSSEEYFIKSTEQANLNASYELMEVEESMPTDVKEIEQSSEMSIVQTLPQSAIQKTKQSSPLRVIQAKAQSPPPVIEYISQTVEEPQEQTRSMSPPLPTMQPKSQSPPLPAMKPKSQAPPLPATESRPPSPPLPAMKPKSQSPPLPATESRPQSPPLPAMKPKSQSPPLPVSESKTQSPPVPTLKQRSQSPPLPAVRPISQSSPLSSMQLKSQSPPLPAMQPISQSPPVPAMQAKNQSSIYSKIMIENPSEPNSTSEQVCKIKEQISPPLQSEPNITSSFVSQPLSALIQKRPSIRDARARAAEILSAKEQSNIKVKDEKDIVVEKLTPSPTEDVLPTVTATSTTLTNTSSLSEFERTSLTNTEGQELNSHQVEDEFSGNNLILNQSDFDYLLTKGNNNTPVDRSSLLLKFDPLLGVPVPVNQGQPQLPQLQVPTYTNNNPCLSPTLEEDEHNDSNRSFVLDINSGVSAKLLKERSQEVKQKLQLEEQVQQNKQRQTIQGTKKKNATMSVDVIKDMSLDNDCNKAFENSNSTQSDDKQINYEMDELEKKIKNEVLKTEDIEKKLKDAEQREEALIKRITEKDKTIAKMTGVIEAYEKAIAELIADKEQITQHYEKQLAEVKADRDSNYHHLTSLETTFSDLHVKYEKSKEMTCQLKESEEALQAEKRKNLENLHLQEQRYDKMKNHAMQQLEIANKKLESLTREHSIEITKLKALLKKEEIARSSINEQLAHKTKENAELVKICDELISGQGIS